MRKILFPFAVLYGWITQFRNFLYDSGIFKSYRFDVPVIAVGNLSVGGTGKTPQIEYLIRLISTKYRVATLSRGYKRKSKGFVLAGANATAALLGDEPFQFHQKFPNITVAVDADRKNGIENLLAQKPKPDVILLDDAYQHRRVKAGFYILLTQYGDLFSDDWMLPTGNLREPRKGAKRADAVIVTKCPALISEAERAQITQRLALRQPVFFTSVAYENAVCSGSEWREVSQIRETQKLLLAGIAKPAPFFAYLQRPGDSVLTFADHHHFSAADIAEIKRQAQQRVIVTTEKDYVRLKMHFADGQLFYLPIKTAFVSGADQFDAMLLQYISTNQ